MRTLLCLGLLALAPHVRAQSVAPVPNDAPAVQVVLAELQRIAELEAGRRTQLSAAAFQVHGDPLPAAEYARVLAESRKYGLALIDELLLATSDSAARTEIHLWFLRYPEDRSVRESLRDALATAPAGRVKARVYWKIADEIWVDETERGIQMMSLCVAEDPGWADARVQRAWIQAHAQRWPGALADLDQAQRIEPARAGELGVLRARFELMAGRYDEACDHARAERLRVGAPPDVVVPAALIEAVALQALDSPVEVRGVLKPVLATCSDHWNVFDFLPTERTLPVRVLIDQMQSEPRRAAERAQAEAEKKSRRAQETIGIDKETDEQRNAREAEEMRVAEARRRQLRAEREAARPAPKFIDVVCDACAGSGGGVANCSRCNGSGRELYRTRTRTEREQQGAYWVVRTIEEKCICAQCDGVGRVGVACPTCHGDGLRTIESPPK